MTDMACWYSLEMSFHEEFKYEIVILIHLSPKISGPVVKGLTESVVFLHDMCTTVEYTIAHLD